MNKKKAMKINKTPFMFILVSAFLFGVSVPFAKILVYDIPPVPLAGFLYLGAFLGLSLYSAVRMKSRHVLEHKSASIEKKDIPWLIGAIIAGGVIGPICLMIGLTLVSGFTASLLLNLEGLCTALIAVLLFKEHASMRVWVALCCMTIAGVFLTWDTREGVFTVMGALLIIFAMVCWGIDNNLTRKISDKDPVTIAKIKGLAAGTASLTLALILGVKITWDYKIAMALLLGALSYGISLVFFIKALKDLGSLRTVLFFSSAPFIGAIASLLILREWIGWTMFPAMTLMIVGVWLTAGEKHVHLHIHEPVTHNHLHTHTDMHHLHEHTGSFCEPHTHEHTHARLIHTHEHYPDTHHRHVHKRKRSC